jgi:hypothetical protein
LEALESCDASTTALHDLLSLRKLLTIQILQITSVKMAAPAQNPAVRLESKSAKKKKAKAQAADTPAPAAVAEVAPSAGAAESENGDGSYESPYIKELYK